MVRAVIKDAQQSLSVEGMIEFRKKLIQATLTTCPSMRKFHPSYESISFCFSSPVMSNETFLLLFKSPSFHGFVYPIVKDIPHNVLVELINCLFDLNKTPTLGSLGIFTEFATALIYQIQYEDVSTEKTFQSIVEYLKNFQGAPQSDISKSKAYLFLYSLQILRAILQPPATSSLSDSVCICNKKLIDSCSLRHCMAKQMLDFCQDLVRSVDVDTFVTWSEINHVMGLPNSNGDSELKIQTSIGYTAYEIIDIRLPIYCTDEENHKAKFDVGMIISSYPQLKGFLKQVAIDPSFDPDSELCLEQISTKLENLLVVPKKEECITPDSKQHKYLSMIINWKDSKELFEDHSTVTDLILSFSIGEKLVEALTDKVLQYPGQLTAKWKDVSGGLGSIYSKYAQYMTILNILILLSS